MPRVQFSWKADNVITAVFTTNFMSLRVSNELSSSYDHINRCYKRKSYVVVDILASDVPMVNLLNFFNFLIYLFEKINHLGNLFPLNGMELGEIKLLQEIYCF